MNDAKFPNFVKIQISIMVEMFSHDDRKFPNPNIFKNFRFFTAQNFLRSEIVFACRHEMATSTTQKIAKIFNQQIILIIIIKNWKNIVFSSWKLLQKIKIFLRAVWRGHESHAIGVPRNFEFWLNFDKI